MKEEGVFKKTNPKTVFEIGRIYAIRPFTK